MLYVGAHVDVFPLTCAELRRAYSRFVYVDGTPESGYWPSGCLGAFESTSELVMMECMQQMGVPYAGMSDFTQQPCGGYLATLADDSSVIYYFNSPDCAGVPRDVLDSVTALYMQGHEPDASVVGMIPNVARVYSTPLCVGPVYWSVVQKCGIENSVIIQETDWSRDDDEFVVMHLPRRSRLESDAPVRYECPSDSEEDSIDWGSSDSDSETSEAP
jgi:hypothetical protein